MWMTSALLLAEGGSSCYIDGPAGVDLEVRKSMLPLVHQGAVTLNSELNTHPNRPRRQVVLHEQAHLSAQRNGALAWLPSCSTPASLHMAHRKAQKGGLTQSGREASQPRGSIVLRHKVHQGDFVLFLHDSGQD